MSTQEELFYESAEQAIDNAIQSSGKGSKAIAAALWPSLKQDTAYARLRNSLNPEKPEKLSFDEIILICQITSRLDPIFYMADELSCTRPEFRAPADEAAILANQMQQILQVQKTLMDRFERLQHPSLRMAK